MKFALFVLATIPFLFSSCLFNEPVFDKGFAAPDASLAGVWSTNSTPKDSRRTEFAVCMPANDRLAIHYPAGPGAADGGTYYEARQIALHGRTLLQLRLAATFKDGPTKPTDKIWTLLWIDRKGDDTIVVRSLKGEEDVNPNAAGVRRALEKGPEGWESRFSEPQSFDRLPVNDEK